MCNTLARGALAAALLLLVSACGDTDYHCGDTLVYDPSLHRCVCPDEGIFVCDTPDDCRCDPRDAGLPLDATTPEDAGTPDDGARPDGPLVCGEGETVCSGACVDISTSRAHCGRCGRPCADGTACAGGECFDAFVDLAAGRSHVCGVRVSGSVWCWGYGADGQLGDGTTTGSTTPVQVEGIHDAVAVDAASGWGFGASSTYTCALRSGGTVSCWGLGDSGQLGDRARASRARPVSVIGLDGVLYVAAGAGATCAAADDERGEVAVSCWGGNDTAQLGSGTASSDVQLIPTPIDSLSGRVRSLDLSWAAACVAYADGTITCWGLSSTGGPIPPTTISGLPASTDIVLGIGSFCALGADGQARCWGELRSTGMEAPADATISTPTPVAGGSSHLRRIFGGHHEFCGLDEDGLICWGGPVAAPARVATPGTVTDVALGQDFACAIVDGRPMCWGDNASGQLGTGTHDPSAVPVPVVGLF